MLSINLDGLEDNVKPAMKNTMKYLQRAQDIFYSMTIPSDFSYASTLRSMPGTISNIHNRVNTNENWIENTISNFSETENNNSNLLNSISSLLDGLNVNEMLNNTATISTKQEESDPIGDFLNFLSDTWDAAGQAVIDFGNLLMDAGEMATQTASNIGNEFLSFLSGAWDTACDWGENVANFFTNDVPEMFNNAGGAISDGWSYLCENTIVGDIVDFGECVFASAVNTLGGVFKGLAELGESLVDMVAFLGTGVASIFTGAIDGLTYLGSMIMGDTSNWESLTGQMWSGTMGFIAEDYVGNAFKDFYENNMIGQWLDEHAHDWFKSDGPVVNFVAGVSFVLGIIGLTIVTDGIFGLGFAAMSAIVGGFSAGGQALETVWGAQRDSSMVGIEEMHEKGEISDEEYEMIVSIRSLSDEDMAELEQLYKNGEITKEDYETVQQIRNIPEDWRNFNNWLEGVREATIAGVSEALQWWLGSKIAGVNLFNNKFANIATRVGLDTLTGGADKPFRALLDLISSGRSFDEALEELGGWEAVFQDSLIALGLSVTGEAVDIHKTNQLESRLNRLEALNNLDDSMKHKIQELLENNNSINISKMSDTQLNKYILQLLENRNFQINEAAKYLYGNQSGNISDKVRQKIADGIDSINRTDLLDNLDENTATSVRNLIIGDYFNNKISLEDISNLDIGNYLNMLNTQEISNILKDMDMDTAFEYLSNGNGKYGVDQGLFTTLEQRDPVAYQEMKNKLMNEYGFSAYDSERFMQIVDAVGACPYARTANVICDYFKDMPEKFEEIFGFPLYKKNSNGVWELNDAELLADLYYWGNTQGRGAVLIKFDENGNAVINEDAIKMENGEISMVMQRGSSWKELSDYLASKTDSIQCESSEILNYSNFGSKDNIINELRKRLDNGEILSVGFGPIDPNIPIRFENAATGKIVSNVSGGHWVKIIDVTDDGLIVSSWGIKCFVSFDDLINNSQFSFISDSISLK